LQRWCCSEQFRVDSERFLSCISEEQTVLHLLYQERTALTPATGQNRSCNGASYSEHDEAAFGALAVVRRQRRDAQLAPPAREVEAAAGRRDVARAVAAALADTAVAAGAQSAAEHAAAWPRQQRLQRRQPLARACAAGAADAAHEDQVEGGGGGREADAQAARRAHRAAHRAPYGAGRARRNAQSRC